MTKIQCYTLIDYVNFLCQEHDPIISRVIFEAPVKERQHSHLKVQNNGTTAIYYDWRKVSTPPSFDTLKRDKTQRFYFNTGEGKMPLRNLPIIYTLHWICSY